MLKFNSEPRFIIAIAVAIVAFIAIALVKSNSCRSIECWGSKLQIMNYVDNPELLSKIKKQNKRWAFSNSFARARVFATRYQNKWFADWWYLDHWDYTIFEQYTSKDECYRSAYKTVYNKLYSKIGSIQEAIQHINAKSPVRCFPAGTPVANRWRYRPPRLTP